MPSETMPSEVASSQVTSSQVTVRFGHGPDADDAFVFEPLIHRRIDTEGIRFVNEHLPFDELNRRAAGDDPFEVTMLSAAALARLTHRWLALPFGGSFVHTMGPTLVARAELGSREIRDALVAVPGVDTTATLLLRLAYPDVATAVVPYDQIAACVASGAADAGVVIHEGQLDFARHGLVKVVDLGLRWKQLNGLPTPLAVCAIRSDVPASLRERIVRVLARSLSYVQAAPHDALDYARDFCGDLGGDAAEVLIDEYVRQDTFALGHEGRRAIQALVRQAQLLAAPPALAFAAA